ncbi:MAG: cache domain-containing protein [Rhizomicrobium sp.]
MARADMIASLDATREAVAAKDRAKLLALYAEMYQSQHDRFGVAQAQFHIPPSVSLLRLHSPAAFGDDLTRSRPMVTAVNRDHQPAQGLRHRALRPRDLRHRADPRQGGYAYRQLRVRHRFRAAAGPAESDLRPRSDALCRGEAPARLRQGRRSLDLQRPEPGQPSHPLPQHQCRPDEDPGRRRRHRRGGGAVHYARVADGIPMACS